jgi:hypothetical protein
MRKKILTSLLLFVASVLPALGQSGNTNPTQIQAERMLLLMFADPSNGTGFIQGTGISPDDQAVVASNAASFLATYNSLVNSGDPGPTLISDRDIAVANTFSSIQSSVSSQGWTTLSALIANEQTNGDMQTAPGSDMVFSVKFANGGGLNDGEEGEPGWVSDVLLDGYPYGGYSCSISSTSSAQFTGGNTWSSLGGGSITNISAASDGTLAVSTSGGTPFLYNNVENSWTPLPGAGSEVAAGSINSVYIVGTDSHLYRYDPVGSAWHAVSGAPAAIQHIAAMDEGSVVMSNGTTVYAYSAPYNTWHTFTTGALSQIVSLSAVYQPAPNGSGYWNIEAIDNAGRTYVGGWYVAFEYPVFQQGAIGTGYTGTPYDIHLAADGTAVIRTTTGIFQRNSSFEDGMPPFSQVTGQSGSVVGTGGANSVYVFTSAGVKSLFGNMTLARIYNSAWNQYVNVQAVDYVNNLPASTQFGNNASSSVKQTCNGVQTTLFSTAFFASAEIADTLEKAVGAPFNPYACNSWFEVQDCAWWTTVNFCTNTPDYNPMEINDSIEPAPWGWDAFGICESPTGTKPWECTHGIAWKWTSYQPSRQCTSR